MAHRSNSPSPIAIRNSQRDERSEMTREEDVQKVREVFDAEFEEFVSVAAHNLREPLRDVASFSQLLSETHAGQLDAEGAEWLDRIGQGIADAVAAGRHGGLRGSRRR